MKQTSRILTGLLLLLAGVFGIAYLDLPAPMATQLSERDYVAEARAFDVEILRDNWGVPHIYGETDADAAFGLAYAHAEDDFATIQSVILATRGSLAAEKGLSAAKTDYLALWMGIWPAVSSGYSQLSPEARAVAEAYAAGLNLYAAQHPEAVSRYLLPVVGEDLVAGFTFKTPMFYGFDKVLGELLDPKAPHEVAKNGEDSLAWVPQQSLPTGSQGIAVAPSRSSDGATRLLVNSHQPLTGPVAWYEAQVHSLQGWNMTGGTFPGAPVIIHGHNEYLGWANTVNKPDLVDIYQLTINPQHPDQYLLDGQWHNFDRREAKIRVKLFGPLHWTFNKEILIAEQGPVFQTEYGSYAVRWAGMGEVRTLDFMLALNKATNKSEFEAALKMQAMPSINYVYADREGNIGHYYNAMFPARSEGWDWSKYLPGDRSDVIWHGYRDFRRMPKTLNPKSGLVYNANNPPFQATDGDDDAWAENFPPSMGIEKVVTNRALQIEALYGAREKISAEDFMRLKFDNHYNPASYQVRQLRQWLRAEKPAQFGQSRYRDALKFLADWDLSTDKEDTHAALAVLTLEPIQEAHGQKADFAVIDRAFKETVDQLYEFYGTIEVPFGEINRHVRGEHSWPLSGGPDTLRAVYGGPLNNLRQFENRAGDSFIMVVSWDRSGKVHSRAIHNFGSATLDTTSPHYADQAELFVREELRDVYLERAELLKHLSRRYRPNATN
ncbi:penicillin acylase family protein [Microbulbifer hainanensis]|uniref:penicillin acylase family protein n=1 Tax=Microbulbifer hainanensis TaxID=2735675 RepID=UPI001868B3BB|nr:penicillin acylase family protein [Microbulbifer hainanensis]